MAPNMKQTVILTQGPCRSACLLQSHINRFGPASPLAEHRVHSLCLTSHAPQAGFATPKCVYGADFLILCLRREEMVEEQRRRMAEEERNRRAAQDFSRMNLGGGGARPAAPQAPQHYPPAYQVAHFLVPVVDRHSC